MAQALPERFDQQISSSIRVLAEQAFSRTAGAPLIAGNHVRLLKDAKENYPAWLDAIRSAREYILFESYIIHDDDVGQEFCEALSSRAIEGVRVRVIYDWLGALGKTSRGFWERLRRAGAEVRCFNPPRVESPLGWLTRDHRKMIAVDGDVAFVTGLCVGRMWVGRPERSIEPWRDTGIEVRGPAIAEIESAFNQVWSTMGPPLAQGEIGSGKGIAAAGDVAMRVVASVPNTAGLYRLDQLIAAIAKRFLWLTDAYFVGATPYIQALRAAAMDGVDVRLLVPGATDIPILRAISRAAYQPLLESGVRIFEWNGPMIHAKTAVADGRWARVGSTNLNLASWVGNYELDVAIENDAFASAMADMFLDDLDRATEVVLSTRQKVRLAGKRPSRQGRRRDKFSSGSVSRAGAGAIRIGSAVGAAFTNHRVLGSAEAKIMVIAGLCLVAFGLVGVLWPRWVTVPLAVVSAWMALALLVRAYRLRRDRKKRDDGLQAKE